MTTPDQKLRRRIYKNRYRATPKGAAAYQAAAERRAAKKAVEVEQTEQRVSRRVAKIRSNPF